MSYESCHMEEENRVEICRFRGRSLTIEELTKITLEDIFGWNKQHYGNTKFEDLAIIIAWFKQKFNLQAAAIMVGYNIQYGVAGINDRLMKINSKDLLSTTRICIKVGLITKSDLANSLTAPLRGRRSTVSKASKVWAKKICKSAITKAGTTEKAAKALGIGVAYIDYWLR